MNFLDKLAILKDKFKSIKTGDHLDRIEGPIDKNVIIGIQNAIKNRLMIQIYYFGDKEGANKKGWRFIQPYCYGLNKFTGNHVLRAYQLSGPSVSGKDPYWRLFRLDRIGNIAVTKQRFDKPVYLFNPKGDKGMSSIISIIKFPKSAL